MNYLALTINGTPMQAPPTIPTGGLNMLEGILGNGLVLAMVFAAIFALFIILRGGIQWIASGGEKGKVEQARMRIIYGILGLLLVFVSYAIINLVLGLFGV